MYTLQPYNCQGVYQALLIFPHHCRHDSGDLELVLRFDGLVLGIGGDEGDRFAALAEIFHGPLSVHLGDHDVAALRRLALVHDDHIAGQDARAGHGIAGYF